MNPTPSPSPGPSPAPAPHSIGIIGVGEIARALVEGWCGDGSGTGAEGGRGQAYPAVHLSPRGAETAAELAGRFADVRVCGDNQEVVDRATVVIIAVRPQDRGDALAGLTIPDDRVVISVMAGVSLDELRESLGTGAPLVRAIPLPAVRERNSLTVVWPAHPVAAELFDRLGGSLVPSDESAFGVFSALTGTLTSHYWYLATLTEWASEHGVAAADVDRYVRGLFQGVGRALGDTSRSLPQLANDHETPNGSNERIRTTWFDAQNARALRSALDGLLTDLTRRTGPGSASPAPARTSRPAPGDDG